MPRNAARLLFFLLFCARAGLGQDAPKVLFQKDDVDISGFGTMLVEFASIEGNASICNGGGGAAIFDRKIFVGGYMLNLAHELNKPWKGEMLEIEFSYGGLFAGYLFQPHKMVHFGISSRVGWGSVRISPENNYISFLEPSVDEVVVWTPQADVELNIAYWLKLNGAIGYRSVGRLSPAFFSEKDFNSMAVSLGLVFGWFK